MLALVLLLFGRLYLNSPSTDTVLSGRGSDILTQFVPWREYAFSRIAHGDIPLWNPHTFSGQSFVGNWQTAMFYPPNYLHLLMPVAVAITVVAGGHVYLAGLLFWYWLIRKGLSPLAATCGGIVYMMSAPVLGHAFPGHITWLCVVAWTPLLFRCVDGMLDTGRGKYAWIASITVAMMVLAGYPQPVYISLLAAGMYLVLCLWESTYRWRAVAGFVTAVGMGVLIAAAQAGPGLEATLESARSGGAKWEYATSYALPLRNLLLAISPVALGGPGNGNIPDAYRGEWTLWEVWPYLGGVAFILAVLGATRCWGTEVKSRRWAVTLLAVFLLIAIGPATPLYRFIYEAVPGASSFRVPGRYLLIVALFGALLVGCGVQHLLLLFSSQKPIARARLVLACCAAIAAVFTFALAGISNGLFVNKALVTSGVLFTVTTCIALLLGRWKAAFPVLLVLALGELTLFGFHVVRSSSARLVLPPSWQISLANVPQGSRVHVDAYAFMNIPLRLGLYGLTGYDPFQSMRYVEFFTSTQGLDPRLNSEAPDNLTPHPAWRTLRATVSINREGMSRQLPDPLPHVLIIPQAEVIPEAVTRISRLTDPAFDFTRKVLLETPPKFPTVSEETAGTLDLSAPATAQVITDTGDTLTIAVSSPRMAYLLVTDAFAQGWEAIRTDTGAPLPVMPANQIVRAVPLPPGNYQIKMEYRPLGWLIGRWLTPVGLLLWGGWGLTLWVKKPPKLG